MLGEGFCDGNILEEGACDGIILEAGEGVELGDSCPAGAGARFVFLTHPSVEHQKPSPQSSAVPHDCEQYCSPFSSTAQNASASVQSASTLQDVPIAAAAELTHKKQQQRASSSAAVLAIIV